MTVEQWMRDKNIANYGPHLEPIIRLAFEGGQSDGYESGFEDGQASILDHATISLPIEAQKKALLDSGLWEAPENLQDLYPGGRWFLKGQPYGFTLRHAFERLQADKAAPADPLAVIS